ncbi:BPL-N domain-containing protein [Psychrobacter sp. B38]|uniref:BPL-N domain-containing protein n=1 Tax=Psychrobacter sp. B38 TaxID=3143538 RepID=UPI00320ED431
MTNTITVWVYDDEGTSELSVKSALATAQTKLSGAYTIEVCSISSKDILSNIFDDNILDGNTKNRGVLIIPGGADLPYCQKLNGLGNDIIRRFVSRGNIYIGICAGGYYGARDIEFSGEGYEIHGDRELAFFPGTAIGSIQSLTNEQLYDEKVGSKAITTLNYADGQQDDVYYHGGAYFLADKDAVFNTLATYYNGKNAVVSGHVGKGQYLLSGVHFELCPIIYEKYAVAQAKASDLEKETQLLAAIRHEHYGVLIYKQIERMMDETFDI